MYTVDSIPLKYSMSHKALNTADYDILNKAANGSVTTTRVPHVHGFMVLALGSSHARGRAQGMGGWCGRGGGEILLWVWSVTCRGGGAALGTLSKSGASSGGLGS